MRTIHFSDEYELSVQGSPWALILYRREFSTDDHRADWHSDFYDAYHVEDDARAAVDLVFLLQTAWAMGRNADDSLPSFDEWAKELDISMSMRADWAKEVQDAIFAEIFRDGASEAPKPKTTRRKAKQ